MAHQLKCLACTSINGVDIVQVHVDHDTPDFPFEQAFEYKAIALWRDGHEPKTEAYAGQHDMQSGTEKIIYARLCV